MAHALDPTVHVDPDTTIFDRRFAEAGDVVDFATRSGMLGSGPSCESWHLDPDGRFVCGTNGTSLDSLASWAADAERLVSTYLTFRTEGSCSPRWIVVDERAEGSPEAGEADVEQFVRLRRRLDVVGIDLMDAVIFDGTRRWWWSMCELLTGTTAWQRRPFPVARYGRALGSDAAGAETHATTTPATSTRAAPAAAASVRRGDIVPR